MYHRVGRPGWRAANRGLWISPRLLARQLGELRSHGIKPGSLDELGHGAAVQNSVTLTFDDAHVGVHLHALGILRAEGFKATVFVVSNSIGGVEFWNAGQACGVEAVMDRAMLGEWLREGHSLGSHTLTHPHLTRLNLGEAREEICASKKMLEDEFGTPVLHFCYPYGDWNPAVADLVQEAGYRTACTTEFGVNPFDCARLQLQRLIAFVPLRDRFPAFAFLWRR